MKCRGIEDGYGLRRGFLAQAVDKLFEQDDGIFFIVIEESVRI